AITRQARRIRDKHPTVCAPSGAVLGADLGKLRAGKQPRRADEIADLEVESSDREIHMAAGWQGRGVERQFDQVSVATAGCPLDLIQPEVVRTERCPGAIVA